MIATGSDVMTCTRSEEVPAEMNVAEMKVAAEEEEEEKEKGALIVF